MNQVQADEGGADNLAVTEATDAIRGRFTGISQVLHTNVADGKQTSDS